MLRKYSYKDMERFRKTRNSQKRRYYGKTSKSENYHQRWTLKEIEIVLKHEFTDNEISKMIGRSVASIQTCRNRYKGGYNEKKSS